MWEKIDAESVLYWVCTSRPGCWRSQGKVDVCVCVCVRKGDVVISTCRAGRNGISGVPFYCLLILHCTRWPASKAMACHWHCINLWCNWRSRRIAQGGMLLLLHVDIMCRKLFQVIKVTSDKWVILLTCMKGHTGHDVQLRPSEATPCCGGHSSRNQHFQQNSEVACGTKFPLSGVCHLCWYPGCLQAVSA